MQINESLSTIAQSPRDPILKAISVENLSHFFGKGELQKQVLFDINLSIDRGEIGV